MALSVWTAAASMEIRDGSEPVRTEPPVLSFLGSVYHVSPSGSDAFAGTEGAPFRSIGFALTQLAPGDTLVAHEGVYYEQPEAAASGTAEAPITIEAAPGEVVVIDPGGPAFRSPGNQDWELFDASRGEYRSVDPLPEGNVYAYVDGIAGYENGRVGLVPYASEAAFRSLSDQHVDSSTPFYIGPGTWQASDGRVHIRLSKTSEMRADEARHGTVFDQENDDPGRHAIVLSTAETTLTVSGSYLIFRGLTFHQAQRTIALTAGAHDLTFDGVTVWAGDNAFDVTGTGVHHVSITRSRIYGDFPRWIAWSDAKNAPAPASLMRGNSINFDHGATDLTVSHCHVRGGYDGIGMNENEDRLVIRHNRIENFADDALELEGSIRVGSISVYENYIANSLVAIAPGQDSPLFVGPLLIYRNVISLLRNPFVNRKAGLNTWNGGGRFGFEYMFKNQTGSDDSGSNIHVYHNTLLLLGSGGKGLNLVPKDPTQMRLANNLCLTINGAVNRTYRTGPGQIVNGNLYWKMNTVDILPLLSTYGTVPSFSLMTGFETEGIGVVPGRGTDPRFATLQLDVVDSAAAVWEMHPSSEVHRPSSFFLGPGSPAIGAGIVIPPHPILGELPDSRSSSDLGAIPSTESPSSYDVFPFVDRPPATVGSGGGGLPVPVEPLRQLRGMRP